MKSFGNLELQGGTGEILNLKPEVATQLPTEPNSSEGEIFYLNSNDSNQGLYYYDGSSWQRLLHSSDITNFSTSYLLKTGDTCSGSLGVLGSLNVGGSILVGGTISASDPAGSSELVTLSYALSHFNYSLPVATSLILGGVKTGSGVTIAADGTISSNILSVAGRIGTVVLTKSDVGLDSVDNKSSTTIRSEITSGNVTTALGYTPENPSNKGATNGYASLDATGKIPTGQLPFSAYTLPAATASTLGGIKLGDFSLDANSGLIYDYISSSYVSETTSVTGISLSISKFEIRFYGTSTNMTSGYLAYNSTTRSNTRPYVIAQKSRITRVSAVINTAITAASSYRVYVNGTLSATVTIAANTKFVSTAVNVAVPAGATLSVDLTSTVGVKYPDVNLELSREA